MEKAILGGVVLRQHQLGGGAPWFNIVQSSTLLSQDTSVVDYCEVIPAGAES